MEDYFKRRRLELNQDAQQRKDKFVNDMIRVGEEFKQEWTALNNKLIELEKEESQQDKVNKK